MHLRRRVVVVLLASACLLLACCVQAAVVWSWDVDSDGFSGISYFGNADSDLSPQCGSQGLNNPANHGGLHQWVMSPDTRYITSSNTYDLSSVRNGLASEGTTTVAASVAYRFFPIPEPCSVCGSCNGIGSNAERVRIGITTDGTTGTMVELDGFVGASSPSQPSNHWVDSASAVTPEYLRLPVFGPAMYQVNPPGVDGWIANELSLDVTIGSDSANYLHDLCSPGLTAHYRTDATYGADQFMESGDRIHVGTETTSGAQVLNVFGRMSSGSNPDTTLTWSLPAAANDHTHVEVVLGVVIGQVWDNDVLVVNVDGETVQFGLSGSNGGDQCYPDSYPCTPTNDALTGAETSPVGSGWRKYVLRAMVQSTSVGTVTLTGPPAVAGWSVDEIVVCTGDPDAATPGPDGGDDDKCTEGILCNTALVAGVLVSAGVAVVAATVVYARGRRASPSLATTGKPQRQGKHHHKADKSRSKSNADKSGGKSKDAAGKKQPVKNLGATFGSVAGKRDPAPAASTLGGAMVVAGGKQQPHRSTSRTRSKSHGHRSRSKSKGKDARRISAARPASMASSGSAGARRSMASSGSAGARRSGSTARSGATGGTQATQSMVIEFAGLISDEDRQDAYTWVVKFLSRHKFLFLDALDAVSVSTEHDNLAETLVALYACDAGQRSPFTLLDLATWAIQRDIKRADGRPGDMLRNASLSTRILNAVLRRSGQRYVEATLKSLVREIVSTPPTVEIDPSLISDASKLSKNQATLEKLIIRFVDVIVKSIDSVPPGFAHILTTLRREVTEGSREKDAWVKVVADMVFLRYICPVIINPGGNGLMHKDRSISSESMRALLLVSKALQLIASQQAVTSIGVKEQYMRPLISLIAQQQPRVLRYLTRMTSVSSTTDLGAALVSGSDTVVSLAHLYAVVDEHTGELIMYLDQHKAPRPGKEMLERLVQVFVKAGAVPRRQTRMMSRMFSRDTKRLSVMSFLPADFDYDDEEYVRSIDLSKL